MRIVAVVVIFAVIIAVVTVVHNVLQELRKNERNRGYFYWINICHPFRFAWDWFYLFLFSLLSFSSPLVSSLSLSLSLLLPFQWFSVWMNCCNCCQGDNWVGYGFSTSRISIALTSLISSLPWQFCKWKLCCSSNFTWIEMQLCRFACEWSRIKAACMRSSTKNYHSNYIILVPQREMYMLTSKVKDSKVRNFYPFRGCKCSVQ